ncbi:MAG: protein-L-isoaspartate(D-aspartate) O-methyltransferase [Alphaproteobacteria bacterium]
MFGFKARRKRRDLVAELRQRGIRDARVLQAIGVVPREDFVLLHDKPRAYQDIALPISCGQMISQPYVVAYMTEKLAVEPEHDVLEIGSGSGYQAAVLARLCRHVYGIERHALLFQLAEKRLKRLGFNNVTLLLGDGAVGWPDGRQFDRIIVTAAAAHKPLALLEQLREGGRLIAPIGERDGHQVLVQFDKVDGCIETQTLLPVRFVPLIG